MQKILIIKTSSLGDVVHMLPAVYDAAQQHKNIDIDWLVEENFQEVPRWSAYINRVIPVALRRWRKIPFAKQTRQEIRACKQQLQAKNYDLVVDTQGLLKSAILTRWVKSGASIWGYDKHSIREPLASYFYQHKANVSRNQHAIHRNRQLFAQALSYSLDDMPLNYGIDLTQFHNPHDFIDKHYIVALHGTSKANKEWSMEAWLKLIQAMAALDIYVLFPWGNDREKQRAEQLSQSSKYAITLPKSTLSELANIIADAKAVIGMDTGLMHITAALNKQGIGLYPATQTVLTGVLTAGETNLIKNIEAEATKNIDDIINQLAVML